MKGRGRGWRVCGGKRGRKRLDGFGFLDCVVGAGLGLLAGFGASSNLGFWEGIEREEGFIMR